MIYDFKNSHKKRQQSMRISTASIRKSLANELVNRMSNANKVRRATLKEVSADEDNPFTKIYNLLSVETDTKTKEVRSSSKLKRSKAEVE